MNVTNIAFYLLNMLFAVAIVAYGIYAVFFTEKLINNSMNAMKINILSDTRFNKMMKKRWFRPNIKICGLFLILAGLLVITLIIRTLITGNA